MTIYQILTLIFAGGAGIKIWEYAIKRINRKAEAKKIEADTHLIDAQTNGLVGDAWQKLFLQVNTEWQLAMSTIRKNKEDIEELKKLLQQEREECQEKMTILYQKIQFLTTNNKHAT